VEGCTSRGAGAGRDSYAVRIYWESGEEPLRI
jgi:hypothetical protein